jgi:hypothetical protein
LKYFFYKQNKYRAREKRRETDRNGRKGDMYKKRKEKQ